MIRENKIRQKMAEAIRNEISIPDFSRWIMSNSWNMHQDSSPSAVSLASNIHSLLAERSDFSINDSQFINELILLNNRRLLSTPVDIDEHTSLPQFSSERWESLEVPLVLA